eukprot:CAMPEP_0173344448 /NCGR_PEP_ID=MMETSP1144-20121109/11388_1 /TAXON_ID=483371 /ORGANISM="non described non described, Strain CCMP2298" /LENGTH=48 /DNA_ID= /DNA_START= /DNA_END= /DNA_ORIENTATION=
MASPGGAANAVRRRPRNVMGCTPGWCGEKWGCRNWGLGLYVASAAPAL